jgi:hypothetical protein
VLPYRYVTMDALVSTQGRDCRVARQAGALVRSGSESPQESRLRLMIILAGLPVTEPDVDLGDDWFFSGRVDLYLGIGAQAARNYM